MESKTTEEPLGQDFTSPKTIWKEYREWAESILNRYFPLFIIGGLLLTGAFLMFIKASPTSILVGFLLILAGVLFAIVVFARNGRPLTAKECEEFFDLYFSDPMPTAARPDVKRMGLKDLNTKVAELVENMQTTCKDLIKKYGVERVDKWEKPIRQWLNSVFWNNNFDAKKYN